MRCPKCQNADTKVLDSRPVEEGNAIRRRRECDKCQFRFSTYEEMEILDLQVKKRDGSLEPYSRDKLERGIYRSFEKRELDPGPFRKLVSAIEQEISQTVTGGEIQSKEIGAIVMRHIKKVDKVAYIRFACVYREFKDVEEFKQELLKL